MPETVVITGASRGIGRACAEAFAAAGYSVAACYHQSAAAAEELVRGLRAAGTDAEAFCCDVAEPDSVRRMADAVLARFGRADVLIANAGIAQQKLLCDITDAEWRRLTDVCTGGVFYSCRAFLPHMIRRGSGSIVTVSSVWGVRGAACEAHYSAAKAAVIGLTKALAKEVGPSGITVNCIAPGVIDTDMCAGFSGEDMRELAESTPLGRIGTPQEVAAAALFLASPAAGFITGQVLGVDGGFGL